MLVLLHLLLAYMHLMLCVCIGLHVCVSLISILQVTFALGVIEGKGGLERVEKEERMRIRDRHTGGGFI